jgi:hypothetical protein
VAAPVDSARQGTNITTAGTSHAINVGSPAAGTLLIVAIRAAADPSSFTFTGYTFFAGDAGDASDDQMAFYYRWADGTEGATDTLATTNPVKLAAICWEITGAANPASRAPEASAVAFFTTSANTADPPSISPTGGSKEYLFLAVAGQDGEVGAYTAFPTNYANLITANSGTTGAAATNCYMGGASRQLTAASENPGAFTHGAATTGGMAWTIAIHPPVYVKTGLAASPRTGSGEKAVTYTEAGLAAAPMVAAGPKRFNGIDYIKAGIAVMGAITGNVFTKSGAAIAAFVASGTDVMESVETGAAAMPLVAAGDGVATLSKTGLAATELAGAGADVATSVETGTAVAPFAASGVKGGLVFEKTGAAVTVLTALGDAALTFAETGTAVMELTASGSKTVQSSTTYTKTGIAYLGLAPANTFTKAGTAISARTGSGADAVTFVEESNGLEFPEPPSLEGDNPPQMTMSASGSTVVTGANVFTKAGAAITGLTGSGADAVTFGKIGAGVSTRTGSGADQVTFVEAGLAVTVWVASGSKEMATGAGTTYSKTGTAISTRTASGTKLREITKAGAAISTRAGSGLDAVTYGETGAGILVRVASGGNAVTSVETGTGIRGHTAFGVAVGSHKWLTPHAAPTVTPLTPMTATAITLTPAVPASAPLLTPKPKDSH